MTTTIPNFAEVAPGIYRGGQPMDPADYDFLKNIGITDIIKLNGDLFEDEHMEATMRRNMMLFYSEISTFAQVINEPDLQALRDVVGFIRPGTYIHCLHGQDRTGLVVGLYRVLRQGWRKDQAYAEMKAHGFHPELFGLGKAWEDLTRGR